MTLPRIPTFEELLKKVKQPKFPELEELDATQASEFGYNLPAGWKLRRNGEDDELLSPRGLTFRGLKTDEGKITDFQAFRGDKPVRLPQPIVEPPPTEPPPEPPPEEPPVEPLRVDEKEAKALYEQRQREIDIKYRKPQSWEFKDLSEEARQTFLAEEKQAWEEYQANLPGIEQSVYAKILNVIRVPFEIVGAQTRQIAIGTGDVGQAQVEKLIKEGRIQPLEPYENLPFWEQLLWETPAFLDLYRQLGRLVIGGVRLLGKGAVRASLNTGLDRWIAAQSRLPVSSRSSLYPFVSKTGEVLTGAKNKNSFIEAVTNSFLRRQGKTPNKEQAIREAIHEVVNMFVPKGTQTGIVRGGLPSPINKAVWDAMAVPEKTALVASRGLSSTVAIKTFEALTPTELAALTEVPATPPAVPPTEVPTAVPPVAPEVRTLPVEEVSKLETRIPIELIRKDEKEYLAKLTEQIKKEGIREPIVIRIREDGSQIVWDGIHRLIVAQDLGIKDIPIRYIGDEGITVKRPPAPPVTPPVGEVTPTPPVTPEVAPTPVVEPVVPAVPEVTEPIGKIDRVQLSYKSIEEINAIREAIESNPKNLMPEGSFHKYVPSARKKLDDIAWAVTNKLAREAKPPAVEVAKPPVEVTKLAEQLKAKLEAEPVVKPPTPKAPVERRSEIKSLLAEPVKNLPKGTSKITLRKELAEINKSLIPQEKKIRSQIMATVRNKGIGKTQMRDIFRQSGGSRYLTNQELTQLEKTLNAVEKARPITIKGKKVITAKREALIQASKKDLIDQGILTEATYKDILESLKLSTDKYVAPQNFITNSQGSDIIRAMRNTAILNPLGELKFGKPTALKYLTSQIYYAQVLGLKPLTNPLELAKVDFDLANRAMANAVDQKLREVNKAWGVSTKEVISAKAKNVPTKGSAALRDLLDKHEEAPAGLTDKQKELFNWFRNLNRSIINGENEVRKAMGVEEISYRQAYVRHIPDVMARNIMEGTHPLPQNLLYWARRLVSKKIFNPMELHRQLSDDLANLYSKDLAFATKSMVYTGLKEIHLAQPLRAFTEQMGALSDVMPASTRKWVTDYVNQVIKGQQTEFDESINAMVTEGGIGRLIDRVLRPFNRTMGNRPVTRLTTTIGNATIYAVLGAPRPRLARLMIRNLFQRTQELAFHGVTPTLKSFLPDPVGLKELKSESRYLRSYTGIEEMPTELMDKLKKIPLAPYQFTATLNASRGMSAAYHDYIKFFENKKYKDLGWTSEQRTYTEEKGFLYPEEQKLMLEEMELATRAAQYQYIGMGMPEIFRHKTLIPITRLQSWWMNHFTMFHREAFHRFATGETRGGQKLPWTSRVNWLKYLLLGGAILTAMGYGASFGVKVLPHNESPFTQFAVGLVKYVGAGSDWERTQAKRSMYYSWKAIVPGALAYDEFEKLWSGEMPLWQMFFYGRKEEDAPPRIPDWSLPILKAEKAGKRIDNIISMLGEFDQAKLDARLKQAEGNNASEARIAEIKKGDYLYDTTSLRRDMGDATSGLSEKDIPKLEPVAGNYMEFRAQDKEYALLSDIEQEQYIKDNPDYTTNRLFWGEITTIPDLKTANALETQVRKYNIPLDMIPAFQKTDKGQERIPSDRNLWEHYFYYYDLPSTSYLNMTQGQVDDGQLPDKYRSEWEAYQGLRTDFAKTRYRKVHREASYSNWREDFRRANSEFDQWLVGQEYNKPLAKKAIRRPSRAGIAPVKTVGFGAVSLRRAAPTYPTFPKPRISTEVTAPSVPGF